MDDCRSLEARSEESLSRSPSQVLTLLRRKVLMVLMSEVLVVLISEVLISTTAVPVLVNRVI